MVRLDPAVEKLARGRLLGAGVEDEDNSCAATCRVPPISSFAASSERCSNFRACCSCCSETEMARLDPAVAKPAAMILLLEDDTDDDCSAADDELKLK